MTVFFKHRNKMAFGVFFTIVLVNIALWYHSISSVHRPVLSIPQPELTHYVNDYTGALKEETVKKIESQLSQFARTEKIQLVVVLLPSLNNYPIETVAHHIFSKNEIGYRNLDSGALLLIAKEDRKIRIEVGRGLESSLTDALSGRIIDTVLAPALKKGLYDQGVFDAVQAMIASVKGQFDPNPASTTKEYYWSDDDLTILLVAFPFILVTDLKENAFYRDSLKRRRQIKKDRSLLGCTPVTRLLAAIFLMIYLSCLYSSPLAQILSLLTGLTIMPFLGTVLISSSVLAVFILFKPMFDYIADHHIDLDTHPYRGGSRGRFSSSSSLQKRMI